MRFYLIIVIIFTYVPCISQVNKKKIINNITTVKKLYINKIVNNYHNLNRDEAPILKIDKYIDIDKVINIFIGGNILQVNALSLYEGIDPLSELGVAETNVLIFKLVNNKLNISCDINAFDEKYIVRVRDNKLITKEKYYIIASDSSVEIYDEYFNPAFQMQFFKKYNAIYVGGIFNRSNGYAMITSERVIVESTVDKLLMKPIEKDSFFRIYLKDAKRVLPMEKSQKYIINNFEKSQKQTYAKTKILNDVALSLCGCIMKYKDTIKNRYQYSQTLSVCMKKISKKQMKQLFSEQLENIDDLEAWRRIKQKLILNKMWVSCAGFEDLLQELKRGN